MATTSRGQRRIGVHYRPEARGRAFPQSAPLVYGACAVPWIDELRAAARPHPRRLPARQADRGARARARDHRRDQGRLEREPARAVAARTRCAAGRAAAAPPLSRCRRVHAAPRAVGEARRAARAARARQRLNDLLYQLVLATCEPTDEVLTHKYAFLSYRLAAQVAGRPFVAAPTTRRARVRCRRADRGDHAADQARRARHAEQPDRLGGHAGGAEKRPRGAAGARAARDRRGVRRVRRGSGPRSITSTGSRCCKQDPRVVVLRTFSKIYGLAGLRVGYARRATRRRRRARARRRGRSTSSSLALVGATAALDDQEHVAISARARAQRDRAAARRDRGRREGLSVARELRADRLRQAVDAGLRQAAAHGRDRAADGGVGPAELHPRLGRVATQDMPRVIAALNDALA